jgi:hypothetical protein
VRLAEVGEKGRGEKKWAVPQKNAMKPKKVYPYPKVVSTPWTLLPKMWKTPSHWVFYLCAPLFYSCFIQDSLLLYFLFYLDLDAVII